MNSCSSPASRTSSSPPSREASTSTSTVSRRSLLLRSCSWLTIESTRSLRIRLRARLSRLTWPGISLARPVTLAAGVSPAYRPPVAARCRRPFPRPEAVCSSGSGRGRPHRKLLKRIGSFEVCENWILLCKFNFLRRDHVRAYPRASPRLLTVQPRNLNSLCFQLQRKNLPLFGRSAGKNRILLGPRP